MKTLSSNTGNIPKLIRIMTYAVDSIDCCLHFFACRGLEKYDETLLGDCII